jgi:hypothetical protein
MLIGSPSSAPAGAIRAISGVSSSLRTKSVRSRRAADDRTSRRDGFLNEEFDKGLASQLAEQVVLNGPWLEKAVTH